MIILDKLAWIICPLCLETYVGRAILDQIAEGFNALAKRERMNVSRQKFNAIAQPTRRKSPSRRVT